MSRDEVKQIIFVIASTYPNFKPADMGKTIDAWYFFLADFDYNRIAIALKSFVYTSGSEFAPSASKLIELANRPADYNDINEMEAWALVRKAISNSSYNSEAEYKALPPIVQKAVGSPSQLRSWAMDGDFNENVISSNFQRTFRTVQERHKEYDRLPVEMKNMIGTTERGRING